MLLAPATAGAEAASWSCRASAGWAAGGADRVEPLVAGGSGPCAASQAGGPGQATAPGARVSVVKAAVTTASGPSGATLDTQRPRAEVAADSIVIENADASLRLTARALRAAAAGACSSARSPGLTSSSSVRDVTLNGRPIASDREFSEPGVGVNGAPLFGRIRIVFGELEALAGARRQRAIHVLVTDQNGAVVFEAVAGEVAAGHAGPVCDPPPVCPEGERLDPAANRCVDVDVAIPTPPPPVPPLPPLPPGVPRPPGSEPTAGCRGAGERAGAISAARLRAATICLINARRSGRRLRRLRVNSELELAARRHARDMVVRRYFSHRSLSGSSVVDRLLRTRYLRRYGRWRVGEILGWGWGARSTPAAMVAAWMRSPGHRRQILGRYTEIGVGVQRAAPRRMRRSAATWVVEFGIFAR